MPLEIYHPASYRPIFDPTAEFPKFNGSDSWWVDEGMVVLRSFDFEEIRKVVRYRLYPHDSVPRTFLLQRSTAFIDNFLATLSESDGHQPPEDLSHAQKVEQILLRSGLSPSPREIWSWDPAAGCRQDAQAIADSIETESHIQFGKIPFEEIVRASLGYKTDAVEWFLNQHTILYISLVRHFRRHPEEVPIYKEVEKAHDVPLPAVSPAFGFVSRPIQSLFHRRTRLAQVLEALEILAVRFRRQYICTYTMDWNLEFDTKLPYLEDYHNSISAKDLASILTDKVHQLYQEATIELVEVTEDKTVKRISQESIANGDWRGIVADWYTLSQFVWECCVALPNVVTVLENCAKASLQILSVTQTNTALFNQLIL
ncbi:hypothetical protein PENSUB_1057 [Penicillium subrubescens]|uniref:Uncharacterized protein n=1 Tax=Penicillium subrubescens TaxID=1316194 RepID=A0A1Q5ULB3_9EURO|nr:hypothetical protein PENSUB_1057 [Penicillium subrubescens]